MSILVVRQLQPVVVQAEPEVLVAGQLGPQGPPGLTWRGAYAAGTTYAEDDVVSAGGSAWVSLQAANTGHDPASSPTWWELLASKGDQGETGAAGTDGYSVLSGNGVPADETGSNGDWYIDRGTANLYWKTLNRWSFIICLVGPQGEQGEQGEQGAPGEPGPTTHSGLSALDYASAGHSGFQPAISGSGLWTPSGTSLPRRLRVPHYYDDDPTVVSEWVYEGAQAQSVLEADGWTFDAGMDGDVLDGVVRIRQAVAGTPGGYPGEAGMRRSLSLVGDFDLMLAPAPASPSNCGDATHIQTYFGSGAFYLVDTTGSVICVWWHNNQTNGEQAWGYHIGGTWANPGITGGSTASVAYNVANPVVRLVRRDGTIVGGVAEAARGWPAFDHNGRRDIGYNAPYWKQIASQAWANDVAYVYVAQFWTGVQYGVTPWRWLRRYL